MFTQISCQRKLLSWAIRLEKPKKMTRSIVRVYQTTRQRRRSMVHGTAGLQDIKVYRTVQCYHRNYTIFIDSSQEQQKIIRDKMHIVRGLVRSWLTLQYLYSTFQFLSGWVRLNNHQWSKLHHLAWPPNVHLLEFLASLQWSRTLFVSAIPWLRRALTQSDICRSVPSCDHEPLNCAIRVPLCKELSILPPNTMTRFSVSVLILIVS